MAARQGEIAKWSAFRSEISAQIRGEAARPGTAARIPGRPGPPARSAPGRTHTAVSYTHLDVYKRQAYICTDENGQILRPNYLSQGFKKLLKKHGLREIRFHDLRHTSANLLITNGLSMVQVQHWMGHSSISTTIDMYSHLTYEDKRDCMETLKKS